MRSALAVAAAVLMVVAAVFVRGRIDRKTEDRENPLRLTCSTELESVCLAFADREGVRTTVEPAGTTADRLVAVQASTTDEPTDLGLDAWFVPAPWPTIVDEARTRNGRPTVFDGAGTTVGRSPLTILVWNDRAAVLKTRCGEVTIKCVGEAAVAQSWRNFGGPEEWGPVKPQHANPAHHASGIAVVGAGAIAVVGRPDVNRDDLDVDPFAAWFSNLEQAQGERDVSGLGAAQKMLTGGPAFTDAVIAAEAETAVLYASSARRSELALIYPSPVSTLDAVVVRQQDSKEGSRLVDLVSGGDAKKALAVGGWRVEGQPPAPGVGSNTLPPSTGLPAPGVLDALRARFLEVTR